MQETRRHESLYILQRLLDTSAVKRCLGCGTHANWKDPGISLIERLDTMCQHSRPAMWGRGIRGTTSATHSSSEPQQGVGSTTNAERRMTPWESEKSPESADGATSKIWSTSKSLLAVDGCSCSTWDIVNLRRVLHRCAFNLNTSFSRSWSLLARKQEVKDLLSIIILRTFCK